ncbi:MAG: hypothetical protein L7F78_27825, partial [Syntrophales bacterium LBB04]|nr:hypothetical protein [Syntrophales bacterium LBB04]
DEIVDHSIAIIGHRFSPGLHALRIYGDYNVGWLTFKNDAFGMQCLHWWRDKCIDWCCDAISEGRFADQGYLNDWPTRFGGVIVIQNKGANLAPWNLDNYKIELNDDKVLVDGQDLIFYHFHKLKRTSRRLFNSHLSSFKTRLTSTLFNGIYRPYVEKYISIEAKVNSIAISVHSPQSMRGIQPTGKEKGVQSAINHVIRKGSQYIFSILDLLSMNYIFVLGGKIMRV